MDNYNYILENIKEAKFIQEPFPHLEINNFLSQEHLNIILSDDQIHFEQKPSNEKLHESLVERGWKIQQFPGCIPNWEKYLSYLEGSYESGGPDAGITFRLKEIKNEVVDGLIKFMNSNVFHYCLKEKFNLEQDTQIVSAIQKNLTGYEISPHPDIRQKALTYLLNINKNKDIEAQDCHTHLLSFKPEAKNIEEGWAADASQERGWVPWGHCDSIKTVNTNNTMVMFRPNSKPASLHAVKLNYDHLEYQRTQIYGNLMFKQEVNSAALQAINVLD